MALQHETAKKARRCTSAVDVLQPLNCLVNHPLETMHSGLSRLWRKTTIRLCNHKLSLLRSSRVLLLDQDGRSPQCPHSPNIFRTIHEARFRVETPPGERQPRVVACRTVPDIEWASGLSDKPLGQTTVTGPG